jgi:uncharacterized phage protein gp47/JayE
MFQLLDFTSISASMVNYAKATQDRVTDFNVGSVFRTLIEAPAIAIDELYQQMWLGLKEGIPVALYQAFGYDRLAATSGTGSVKVIVTAGDEIVIQGGTVFTVTGIGIIYKSMADAVIAASGTQAIIPVSAEKAGIGVDIPALTAFSVIVPRLVSAVANANFIKGDPEETEALRKLRFVDFIQNLARSTVAALEYALLTVSLRNEAGEVTESVKFALVVEPFMTDINAPKGVIQCYIHNGKTSGASGGLIDACEQTLNGYIDSKGNKIIGWKAAGVQAVINATSNVDVNITATVTSSPDVPHDDVLTAVRLALDNYILQIPIGSEIIKAELIAAAMSVPSVLNFVMSAPSTDVDLTAYQKAIPGTYALT